MVTAQAGSTLGPQPRVGRTVLFIAGTGHSGSTVIAKVLGSLPGVVSVGELRYLWERGLEDRGRCGCGRRVPDCAFWSAVVQQADAADARALGNARLAERSLLRVRHLPKVLRARGQPDGLGPPAVRYAEQLRRVVFAALDVSGCAVLVDSSKLPTYGYLLSRVAALDVKVLHLVRDPRGAAYSWSKAKSLPHYVSGPHSIRHEGPVKSAALWDLWNIDVERMWGSDPSRYVRLRYEDVCSDPSAALEPVLRMLGIAPEGLPVDKDGHIPVPVTHMVAGNPNRSVSGPVRIVEDLDWLQGLTRRDRVAVTAVSGPLLRHFGYRFGLPAAVSGTR